MDFKDRIKEFRRIKASDLLANPLNHRVHPEKQRKALRKTLKEIGFAGALLCREHDGKLILIDGHMRAAECGDAEIPVLILDVNEAEGNKILASYDAIGSMARIDEKILNDLMDSFTSDIGDVFGEVNSSGNIFEEDEEKQRKKEEEENELREKEQKEDKARRERIKSGEELLGVKPGELWKIRDGSYIYCGSYKDKIFTDMFIEMANFGAKSRTYYKVMLNAPRATTAEYGAFDFLSNLIKLDEGWTFTNNDPALLASLLDSNSVQGLYTFSNGDFSQITTFHSKNKSEPISHMKNHFNEETDRDRGRHLTANVEAFPPPVNGARVHRFALEKLIAKTKRHASAQEKTVPFLIIPCSNTGLITRIALSSHHCKILAAEPDPNLVEYTLQNFFAFPARHNENRETMPPPKRIIRWKQQLGDLTNS